MKYLIHYIMLVVFIISGYSSVHAEDEQMIELTISKGDSLIRICREYLDEPRHWKEVSSINRLSNPDIIYPGQTLKIPIRLLKGTPMDGVVTFLKGEVEQLPPGEVKWRPVLSGDVIREGSMVKTSNDGTVEITFPDGSSFLMRPDTSIALTTSRKKGVSHIVNKLYLEFGRMIMTIKRATGIDSRYEIEGPSAVAAVRGTEFRLSVDEKSATRSEVLKGLVAVEAMKHKVEVKEGEGTLVNKGEPPVQPVKLLPPPEPVNIQPVYKHLPAVIQFSRIENASTYRVMLARDREFKDVVKEKIIKPGEFAEFKDGEDGEYFLQGLSIDNAGLEGIPHEAVQVRIRVNPLPPFIQLPLDGAEYRGTFPEFRWLKVSDAAKYHIQIAEDRDFKAIAADTYERDVKHTAKGLDYKTYYFRISSSATDGYEADWSDTLNFTIVPPPPSPPVEKPEMGEDNITIRWRESGPGVTYHFQMAGDEQFSSMLFDRRLESPFAVFPKPETPGTYYVRTSCIDSKGYEGGFSQPQSFEIKGRFPYWLLGVSGAALLFFLAL